jgi:hypothetical protein
MENSQRGLNTGRLVRGGLSSKPIQHNRPLAAVTPTTTRTATAAPLGGCSGGREMPSPGGAIGGSGIGNGRESVATPPGRPFRYSLP